MTDRHTKVTKAILKSKTNAKTVACISWERWVASFNMPFKLLTDTGPQILSKFFVAVRSTLGVRKITTTEYYPAKNGQAEHLNSKLTF